MSSETIMTLVKFLPTLLALAIIILCTLRGFIRGFRKSLILLIHYLISIGVGLSLYFSLSELVLSNELNSYFASLGPEFANANSLIDVMKILLNNYVPNYAAIIANPYIEQLVMAFVGLGISLVIGVVCLVLIPWVIRIFLYLLYLLFYPERRVKKNKLAEGGTYNAHRLLGMVVGAMRGVVCTVLTVSFISSTYFVLSGGVVQTETPTENILLLEGLSDQIGFDLNAVYKGLKESRSTGIGAFFDTVLFEGKPIDLYYSDLFLTSNFKATQKPNSDGAQYTSSNSYEGEMAKFYLREEMAMVFKLLENIMETNAITIADGAVNIDFQILEEKLGTYVTDYVDNSIILSEITPLAIIGLAEAINEGTLVVEENIKEIFTPQLIEEIKKLNISKDLADLISVVITAIDLIPINEETNSFDFAAFSNINTYFSFNPETVKRLFTDLSNIKLLTKVVFPAGIGMALETMEEAIAAAGINATELDFSTLSWQAEIANIGLIYEKIVDLNLDINKLMDQELNESGLTNSLQYILELCTSEELVDGVEKSEVFKTDLLELIDTIFNSKLFGQVGLVFIKSQIAGIEILYEDQTPTPLNDVFTIIKHNLNYYTIEHLKADLHQLVSSCLDVTSMLPLLMGGEEINFFEILYGIETEDLRKALLGNYNDVIDPESEDTPLDNLYKSGLYSIKLLNGTIHKDAGYAIDALISGALKTYAGNVISPESIDSITNGLSPNETNYDYTAWPNELSALIDAMAELQTVDNLDKINLNASNIADILPPEITTTDIDAITYASSKSLLLSGLVEGALVSTLKNEPTIGYATNDPNIIWMDTIVVDDRGNETVLKGEINNLLKAFVIYSDDSKGMDFNDVDSLINGLAQLLHAAETKDTYVKNGLDYQEVVTFTNSQVLMTILSKEISKIASGSEGISIVVPYSLNTSLEGNEEQWKNWAYDSMFNHMNGEFANLVLVLYHARLYLLEQNDETEGPVLTQNNLINAVIYMDNDGYIVQSKVLHATLSDALLKQVTDNSVVKVRSIALENNPSLNPEGNTAYDVIKAIEVDRALDAVRMMKINFTNNDFSQINLQTFLDAISTQDGEDPNEALLARKSIALSNIFNISAITKIADNNMIYVPLGYYDSQNTTNIYDCDALYPASEADWENSEINKILESVAALELEANAEDKLDLPKDAIEFLKTLDENKVHKLYESKIFSFTISKNALLDVPNYRREAIVFDSNGNEYVAEKEINLILKFLSEAGINSQSDMEEVTSKPSKIINLINNSSTLDLIIVESNILNICVVDALKASPLSFPVIFTKLDDNNNRVVDIDASAWYPTGTGEDGVVTEIDIKNSELYNLLNSIKILNISSNDNALVLDVENVLDDLLTIVNGNQTKLDIVYSSNVFAATISQRLLKTTNGETENSVTLPKIRNNGESIYYILEGRLSLADEVIVKEEIEALLTGLKVLNKGFDSETDGFEYSHIFESVMISDLLDKTGNDNETKLDVVLKSSILHYVISDNLIQQKQTVNSTSYNIVTWRYYSDENTYAQEYIYKYDNYIYISTEEIVACINALSKFGITKIDQATNFDSTTIVQYLSNSSNKDEMINSVTNSSIVSMMFSQIIKNNEELLRMIQYKAGKEFDLKNVLGILETEEIGAYAQSDLNEMLNNL